MNTKKSWKCIALKILLVILIFFFKKGDDLELNLSATIHRTSPLYMQLLVLCPKDVWGCRPYIHKTSMHIIII